MHIFLVILKIIGITVLVLLGIIVTLSLLILFVPVRYNIRADFDNDIRLRIDMMSLLRALHCRICYPEGEAWSVRVFGIPVAKDRGTEKKKRGKHKKKIKINDSEKEKDSGKDKDSEKDCDDNKVNEDSVNVNIEKNIDNGRGGRRKRPHRRKGRIKKPKQKKKKTFIKSLTGLIADEGNKRIIVFLKDIVIRLLKRIKPRKIRADMIIGFDDPAHTGLLFGAIGILTVCWKGKYNITPDFEKKILRGRVCARGYVRFADILYYFIKIIQNEDIKRVMKKGKVN